MSPSPHTAVDSGTRRLRSLVATAGGVYLSWWFMVELLLPGSFNPLPGRLAVVALDALLLFASYRSRWVERHLSLLFTAWTCLLVYHYCFLLIGNHGDVTWWIGTFVTFAAVSMCVQSPREVVIFSVFALACVIRAAAIEGQVRHSIYVPGLATILLLAYITKRSQKAAQEAMLEALRAREAAEAVNRELEAFSYSVAHDLRAPLRGVHGFSHMLLEEYGDVLDEEGRGYLRRVQDCATEMARLIDALLELGRLSRTGIRKQRVDLSELARATAKRFNDLEPGRAVEFVIAGGFTEVGDATLLAAAMDNLLGNAWKFTRKQPHARIEFGCVQEGGQKEYFVRDNGAGFDMAFASKLFGAFQRLHTQREFEGTGVGLASLQRIIRRHGGRVWAEGKVGEGACFHFTIGDVVEHRN
jgi:signal transduction histidine kinase